MLYGRDNTRDHGIRGFPSGLPSITQLPEQFITLPQDFLICPFNLTQVILKFMVILSPVQNCG